MKVVRLLDDGQNDLRGKQARYIRKFGPDVCFIITAVGNAAPRASVS